ncbi:hypothetical protein K3725_21395 (plasmid) [Leisingera sp. S132]|uniref:HrpE/YscL family type III secretion apparatus protein n=1 Tax=Leisingera sp. S132 TaxID=2867016 RepID=UPI0021A25E87|nr:HrpE/YscL family type III secretion apparatus protein [Leisingera sp. S132]UWQ81785.1 hypothetical protein K3725_21395 [Leisingera sp. S132]
MRRIELPGQAPMPANGIIRGDLLAAVNEADACVAAARVWAEQEQLRITELGKETEAKALLSGYEAGLQLFAEASGRLDAARQDLAGRVEELVTRSLRQVLGGMPKADLLEATFASVLAELRSETALVARVHPNHASAFAHAVQAFRDRFGSQVQISAEFDQSMSADDCMIYTDTEVINASVPVMVEQLITAFVKTAERGGTDAV